MRNFPDVCEIMCKQPLVARQINVRGQYCIKLLANIYSIIKALVWHNVRVGLLRQHGGIPCTTKSCALLLCLNVESIDSADSDIILSDDEETLSNLMSTILFNLIYYVIVWKLLRAEDLNK